MKRRNYTGEQMKAVLESMEFTLSDAKDRNVADVIRDAARHIEELCPRPGPYHPAFAALLGLAYRIEKARA